MGLLPAGWMMVRIALMMGASWMLAQAPALALEDWQPLAAPVPPLEQLSDATSSFVSLTPLPDDRQLASLNPVPQSLPIRQTLPANLPRLEPVMTAPSLTVQMAPPMPVNSAVSPSQEVTPHKRFRWFGWFRHKQSESSSVDTSQQQGTAMLIKPIPPLPAPTTKSTGTTTDSVWGKSSAINEQHDRQWVSLQVMQPDDLKINTLANTVKSYNRGLNEEQARQLSTLILESSYQHAVDYRLTASIIAVESSFRAHAISPTGAVGFGQLLPTTARWLQVANPFDPFENVTAVSKYLNYLQQEFPGDWEKAVASYFVGQGTVKRSGISPAARAYVQRVDSVFKRLN